MNESQSHWTADEELVEQFVLGRVSPEREGELKRHLSMCETCRAVVDRERRIAAAARRLGRNAMKARLAEHTGATAPGRMNVPWPHIVSIAAVLVIALGLTIYGLWIDDDLVPEETVMQEFEAGPKDTSPKMTEESARFGEAARGTGGKERNELSGRDVERKTDDVDRPSELEEQKVDAAAPAPEALKRLKQERDFTDDELRANAQEPVVSEQLWVQAVILSAGDEGEREMRPVDADGKLKVQTRGDRRARVQEEVAPADESVFALQQKPIVDLPPAQLYRQQSHAPGTLETLLEKIDGQVRVTLFTDDRIDEADIVNATVQSVAPDSVLVLVGTQQFALKIPPSWNVFHDSQNPVVR